MPWNMPWSALFAQLSNVSLWELRLVSDLQLQVQLHFEKISIGVIDFC